MAGFEGKVALITGGSRGIGYAAAAALAEAGAVVAVCARDGAKAAEAADKISAGSDAQVKGYAADVSQPGDVGELVKQVAADLGPIAILVSNAGVTHDGLLIRMKDDEWEEVIRTNLYGAFYCARAVARDMIKQRYGRIITVSSVVGLHGQSGQANYAAAKAGLIGFTKTLAQELASRNVTANVVAPGYVETDMTAGFDEQARQKLTERIPAGRSGRPEEIAAAIRFLASEEAAYITGHVLCVDGGLGM